jgi:hydroxymethylglutaryl-CoA lyase
MNLPAPLPTPNIASRYLPKKVRIVEVGPRDGLQNEKQAIPTSVKVELVNRLSAAGFFNVEAASFVSPKWVPQMSDGLEVMQQIQRKNGTIYSVLTPNMKGLESALAGKANEVVIFGAASEAFSQKNINCSIAESIARFEPVARAAITNGMKVRAAVSVAFGCPYQGEVPLSAVLDVVKRFQDLGCHDIGIADTIGVANAAQVKEVMQACANIYPIEQLSGHFHDTYGQAVANAVAAIEVGITGFDTSVAGLGGCPYAKGATGNGSTEDLIYTLHAMGIETGIDLNAVVATGAWISEQLGRPTSSRAGRALYLKQQAAQPTATNL